MFVKTEKLNAAAEKIAALEQCPFAGKVTADQIKLVIGEVLDLWPTCIADDPEVE